MTGRKKFTTILGWTIVLFAIGILAASMLGYKLNPTPLSPEMTKVYNEGVKPPEVSGLPR